MMPHTFFAAKNAAHSSCKSEGLLGFVNSFHILVVDFNGCILKTTSMFCVADLCCLQAAAHIHKYLNLDEDKLKEITGDSQEGGLVFYK